MSRRMPFHGAGHRPERERSSGFTLIELVIVMAMIGLLLTLAVPRYFHTLDHGKVQVQKQNLASLRDAIDKYFGDQGRYPDTVADLVSKRYLRSVPIDPVTEKADWVAIAPADPQTGGVYDVQSAAKETNAPTAPR